MRRGVVLQQHDALAGHVEGEPLVAGRGNGGVGCGGPFDGFVGVEVAEAEACGEQSLEAAVDVGFGQLAAAYGFGQVAVVLAALNVGAGAHGLGRGRDGVGRHFMASGRVEVPHGPAVAGDEAVESPQVAQQVLLVASVAAARLTVDALVGAHHFGHVGFLDERLERRQIGLPQVTLRQLLDVERVAVPFGSAVYGKVLGAGKRLVVAAVAGVGSLQAAHHGLAHLRREVGVFAVGLLSASPTRVAEDVDVGCPEREALVAFYLSALFCLAGLYACLVAHDAEDAFEQCVVP